MLFRAVPKSLRVSIAVGIGFFITCIGLRIGQIMSTTLASWAVKYHVDPHYLNGDSNINLNFAWTTMGKDLNGLSLPPTPCAY